MVTEIQDEVKKHVLGGEVVGEIVAKQNISKYDFVIVAKLCVTELSRGTRSELPQIRGFVPITGLKAKPLGFFQMRCSRAGVLFIGFVRAGDLSPNTPSILTTAGFRLFPMGNTKFFCSR